MVRDADCTTREGSEITNEHHHSRFGPQAGDVLASRPTARADLYTISILPAGSHLTATRHSEALDKVRVLARELNVDGWYTCNHTHYARVASFRGQTVHGSGRTR